MNSTTVLLISMYLIWQQLLQVHDAFTGEERLMEGAFFFPKWLEIEETRQGLQSSRFQIIQHPLQQSFALSVYRDL